MAGRVSSREVVLHEADRQFLLAGSDDARLRSLLERASSERSRAPYLRLSLTQEEQEYILAILGTILAERGVGKDDDLNAVGRRLEGLIDIFNSQGGAG